LLAFKSSAFTVVITFKTMRSFASNVSKLYVYGQRATGNGQWATGGTVVNFL
jgi:hypothetical protein